MSYLDPGFGSTSFKMGLQMQPHEIVEIPTISTS
jgi:hypothetical protein